MPFWDNMLVLFVLGQRLEPVLGKVKFILLRSIGNACIDHTVTDEEMKAALGYLESLLLQQ